MSIDMTQFHQVFFEETAEHLAAMESLLLTLDVGAPDAEQLNAIFRAAHSIKGSSGTFGFTDLAEITHILESLLDRIRKGEIRLREDMIGAFLDTDDVLKSLLAAHQGKGAADRPAADAICRRLRQLAEDDRPAAPVALKDSVAPAGAVPPEPTLAATDIGLDCRFIVEGAAGIGESVVENLMSVLAEHGDVRIVGHPASGGQPWQLQVVGTADVGMLRELLEFVARNDSIRIAPLGQLDAALADAPDGAYGFFDATASIPAQEETAYGFFAPLPPVAPAPAAEPPVAPPPPADKPAGKETRNPAPAGRHGTDTSIRVSVDKVDQLINLVGELVITQAMLAQSAARVDPVEFERLHNGLLQLERNTRDLQESVMSIRMMPMSVVFSRFPRVVHDVSQKLGKQVELKLSGEDTELDRGLIERIIDPLTHLIRNSLDHGIELPEVRAARGKQPIGTITLSACHQSGNVVIEVGDDGAGLDRQKILAKARGQGLGVHEQMTDQEVFALIFEAGFSTADQVTDVSGRGVGMDVVKRNITAMGGRVEIDSMAGIGMRVTVRLPLTLAILDGMSVAVGRETYIIPLGYVIESLQAEPGMMKSIAGVEKLIQIRDDYLPVVTLHEIFNVPGAVGSYDAGIMIILEANGARAALFVDAMVGQHQVVIKSLESNYRKVAGVAGATIMGDGRVALILDAPTLVGMARRALPVAA